MTTDESKYESACACLIFVALIAAIVTVPWWGAVLDAILEPAPQTIVMDCRQ